MALLTTAAIGGCGPRSQPVYEYGETETTISTMPPPGRAVTSTTLAERRPAWRRNDAP